MSVSSFSQVAQAASQPILHYDDRGPAVKTAESALQHLGFYHGSIDGVFGPQLLAAVKSFQAHDGLATDGIIGPITWGHLEGAAKSPTTARTSLPYESAQPVLRLGDHGPMVVHLQTLLDHHGYHLALDGDYGPLTYAAVRNFQATHHIVVTGIAGAKVFAELEKAAPTTAVALHARPSVPTLREGSRGPAVTHLQRELTQKGYSTHGVDGIFGPKTLAAVIAFQKSHHGLTPNGIVGPLTWKALAAAPVPHITASSQVNRGSINPTGSAIAGYALKYRGDRYVYGGTSPATGFDCSGFTQFVYHQFGISLPRTSYAQWNVGQHVSYDALQPGDLLFFSSGGTFAGHVGIYLGGGQFISATTPSQGVIVQNLHEAYWAHTYEGATRVAP